MTGFLISVVINQTKDGGTENPLVHLSIRDSFDVARAYLRLKKCLIYPTVPKGSQFHIWYTMMVSKG